MKKAWAEGRKKEREKRCDVQRQNDGGPEKNYVMQAGLRSVVEVAGSACSCSVPLPHSGLVAASFLHCRKACFGGEHPAVSNSAAGYQI